MISIQVSKNDVPEIPLTRNNRLRAEYLDMWDTVGGCSEWVQSFIASTAHRFYGKGDLGLGWEKIYREVSDVFLFGETLYETLEYVNEVGLSGEDVKKYTMYCKFVSFLKEDYIESLNSCSYKDAHMGRNIRKTFCKYVICIDDIEDNKD